MTDEKFPYQLTEFIEKLDARYEGDPQGDYVMAEHMNDVQDAIQRIEQALGIREETTLTVEDRLKRLTNFSEVAIPQVGYFASLSGSEAQYLQELAQRYSFLILDERNRQTANISSSQTVYGRIDVTSISLEQIQNEISSWQQAGAQGIYLDNLERDTRQEEVQIVQSVTQEGLDLMVGGDTQRLLSRQVSDYNPTGQSIPFPQNTFFVFKNFGYNEEFVPQDVVMSNLLPLVRLVKQQGHRVIGFTDARSKKVFNAVHTLGILLSIDYMYWGSATGSTLEHLPYTYNWNTMMSDWRTDNPNLFLENGVLSRQVLNGQIELHADGSVSYPGLMLSSDGIDWLKETIQGDAIEVGSIPADRLSTYDIEKIVNLINDAPEDIRIHPTKIDSDKENILLPENIPASHLIQNVIEAINRKNNRNTTEFQYIENDAIKNLDAGKLMGDIPRELLHKNTIPAINDSSTNVNDERPKYINVPYADITNLRGTGQLNYTEIIGDSATFTDANITHVLSTVDIENSNLITSPHAEISEIIADRIQVSRLEGLESLYVPHLESDNMETLVLDAIEATIARGEFDSIITSTLESDLVVSEIIKATTNFSELSSIDQGRITELITDTLTAKYGFFGELAAGTINTDEIQLISDSGLLNIQGDTIQVYSYPDENNIRNLRILIGHLEEVTGNEEDYGFVALDEDGQTRIFDHTGVYEAGIHKDSISEDKIQNDAVTGSKIKYHSIQVDHLLGGAITGDWIDGKTITGSHIVGDTITADHLQALSINAYHLNGAIIEGTHIKGQVIEGRHIQAGAISTEHLRVGFDVNLIKSGYDSFEQYNSGEITLNELNTDVQTTIQNELAYEGDKTLRVFSYENNARLYIGRRIPVEGNQAYGVSLFTRVPTGYPETSIQVGAYLTDGTDGEVVLSNAQDVIGFYRRKSYIVEDTKDYPYIIPVVVFQNSNDQILIDAVQVEKVPDGGEISPWKTTSTTFISGDNIQTGRIDARHIQIGQGTIFGDGDVITIDNTGISARSAIGSAKLGSEGLVITGGAFTLEGGQGNQTIRINGETGLSTENLFTKVELDAVEGFRITNKRDEQVILEIDPESGNLRFSGTAEFFSPDNPEMSLNILDQQEQIERDRNQLLASTRAGAYQLFLGVKVDHRGFEDPAEGFLYFHGYELTNQLKYIPADVPGEVYVNYEEETYSIPNEALDLRSVPEGTEGYIIWDNTRREFDFIYLTTQMGSDELVEQSWTRVKDTPNFIFNESVMVIGELEK